MRRVRSIPIAGIGVCGAQEASSTLTEASGVDRHGFSRATVRDRWEIKKGVNEVLNKYCLGVINLDN